ncbi:AraC family transcriptional regulator [Ralstonia sp. 1138]|uniref:AraC family transcriptional regulator n=1 Tax=Ralstonia sp. 1138 TaxID=3156423 RepID=UPI003395CB36
MEHYGVDPDAAFRAAEVLKPQGSNPMARVPVAAISRLFRFGVMATEDPYFGLNVSRHLHLADLHAFGYALMASSTLMDYCRRLVQYYPVFSSGAREVTLEQDGEHVSLRWHLTEGVCGETKDAVLAFFVTSMRQLYRPAMNPVRVEFHHAMPSEGEEPYRRLFRAPIVFNAPQPALVISRQDLEQPLVGACPELAQYHDQVVQGYLARLDGNDVVRTVRRKIVEFLPTGECGRERVAQAMCMSASTLQIKLAQRDTSFQAILDETRKELACGYVQQLSRPLIEIAFQLGFSDSSNFTRAFKRWTGLSPSDYRLRQRYQGQS